MKVVDPDNIYREIARELGLSVERVRQIERQALIKCRLWCDARGLVLEDLLPEAEASIDTGALPPRPGGRDRLDGAR